MTILKADDLKPTHAYLDELAQTTRKHMEILSMSEGAEEFFIIEAQYHMEAMLLAIYRAYDLKETLP